MIAWTKVVAVAEKTKKNMKNAQVSTLDELAGGVSFALTGFYFMEVAIWQEEAYAIERRFLLHFLRGKGSPHHVQKHGKEPYFV